MPTLFTRSPERCITERFSGYYQLYLNVERITLRKWFIDTNYYPQIHNKITVARDKEFRIHYLRLHI